MIYQSLPTYARVSLDTISCTSRWNVSKMPFTEEQYVSWPSSPVLGAYEPEGQRATNVFRL